jgi:hypothetical protein
MLGASAIAVTSRASERYHVLNVRRLRNGTGASADLNPQQAGYETLVLVRGCIQLCDSAQQKQLLKSITFELHRITDKRAISQVTYSETIDRNTAEASRGLNPPGSEEEPLPGCDLQHRSSQVARTNILCYTGKRT